MAASKVRHSCVLGHIVFCRKMSKLHLGRIYAQTRARRNHWSIRTINDWNTLPASIITARTLNELKNGLDKYWYRERYVHSSHSSMIRAGTAATDVATRTLKTWPNRS